MNRFIVIPDSFKGTLSAQEFCDVAKTELVRIFPEKEILTFPVADGGEGTVDCFLKCLSGKAKKIFAKTTGPFGDEIETYYASFESGEKKCAVIELASCAGLPLAEKIGRLEPSVATTYGVGTLILDAINNGCKKIILALGGSCTNDAGCGIASSVGVKFFRAKSSSSYALEQFVPTGNTLSEICKIDFTDAQKNLSGVELVAMCDITNPLYGENGAAYVFAPQKGADAKMVSMLDDNLRAFAKIVQEQTGIDVQSIEGSGAAGGCGAGVASLLGGKLQSGIETVLDAICFDALLDDGANPVECVITGEGRLDSQSFQGKVISGIAKHVKLANNRGKRNIKLIALCGAVKDVPKNFRDYGLSEYYAVTPTDIPFSIAKNHAAKYLAEFINKKFC